MFKIYVFANKPEICFLETPEYQISKEDLECMAGTEIEEDNFVKSELHKKFGMGFFEITVESGSTYTDILLREIGFIF